MLTNLNSQVLLARLITGNMARRPNFNTRPSSHVSVVVSHAIDVFLLSCSRLEAGNEGGERREEGMTAGPGYGFRRPVAGSGVLREVREGSGMALDKTDSTKSQLWSCPVSDCFTNVMLFCFSQSRKAALKTRHSRINYAQLIIHVTSRKDCGLGEGSWLQGWLCSHVATRIR